MRRVAVLVIFLTLWGGQWVPHTTAQQQDSLVPSLIAALNAWRIQDGLWPVQPNDTLQKLAMAQAQYLLTLPDLPDGGDIHKGPRGEGPKDRARAAPYNWPTYGRPDEIALDEIAYAGHTVQAAIGYWTGSTIHNKTVHNPGYREIGVAILPHKYGHLFIVVFGGRPDVLPALVDPATNQLYLSNENFSGAARSGDWMHTATQFRLLDAQKKPIDAAWQTWKPVLPLPTAIGPDFYVEYSDGKMQVVTEVIVKTSVLLLPDNLTLAVAQAPSPTPQPSATPVPRPTLPPSPTPLAPSSSGSRPTPTPIHVDANIVAQKPPTPTPFQPPTPTSVPPPAANPEVLIVWDTRSLAIINMTRQPVDLSSLVLVQGAISLPTTLWRNEWLTAPLEAFPAANCLQAWSWDEPSDLPPPSQCQTQRAVIYIAPERMFWTKGDFEVRTQQKTVLATCSAQAGQCAVKLP